MNTIVSFARQYMKVLFVIILAAFTLTIVTISIGAVSRFYDATMTMENTSKYDFIRGTNSGKVVRVGQLIDFILRDMSDVFFSLNENRLIQYEINGIKHTTKEAVNVAVFDKEPLRENFNSDKEFLDYIYNGTKGIINGVQSNDNILFVYSTHPDMLGNKNLDWSTEVQARIIETDYHEGGWLIYIWREG